MLGFIVGIIGLVIAVMLWSCCRVSSWRSREEEKMDCGVGNE